MFAGRQTTESPVRPGLIVVLSPSVDFALRFVDRSEPVRVETLLANTAVEGFHMTVVGKTAIRFRNVSATIYHADNNQIEYTVESNF